MKTAKTMHLDEAALLRFAATDDGRVARHAAQKHLVACGPCRKRLETFRKVHEGLTTIGAAERRRTRRPAAAARVAGYQEELGRRLDEGRTADRAAEEIVKAAWAGDRALSEALHSLEGAPWRLLALLSAVKKGDCLLSPGPRRAFALARAIKAEVATRVKAGEISEGLKASSNAALAHAFLLESRALVLDGDPLRGRSAAVEARSFFKRAEDSGFGAALCDYYEGEAATFSRDYPAAETLLKAALEVFVAFGQTNLIAASEGAIATILGERGAYDEALIHFERSMGVLSSGKKRACVCGDIEQHGKHSGPPRSLRGGASTYKKALAINLRHGFLSNLRFVRTSLAELELFQGHHAKALRGFEGVAAESALNGSSIDVLFARLYVAECLGRMERFDDMAREVEALRKARRKTPFGPSPALEELFSCLNQGTLDADLVGHVREYLQDAERGVKRTYRTLRRA